MNGSVSEQIEVGWMHGWIGWSDSPIYEVKMELSFTWP